jgi:hypothetical protein
VADSCEETSPLLVFGHLDNVWHDDSAAITFSQTLGTALGDWLAELVISGTRTAHWRWIGDPCRRILLLDEYLAGHPVLGSVHPHPTATVGDFLDKHLQQWASASAANNSFTKFKFNQAWLAES